MTKEPKLYKYLPLTEATFYIMMALVEPMHGYAIMQQVEEVSKGRVKIGPGTLYGAFSTLEKERLIEMISEENRRKIYLLTDKGKQVLALQAERVKIMNQYAQQIVQKI
ncbi:MAG: PadR family transcriptional regulator [Anaerolineales bacterium]|nr:PadR family transcriptional regulator [Anaerolineales bacterium]